MKGARLARQLPATLSSALMLATLTCLVALPATALRASHESPPPQGRTDESGRSLSPQEEAAQVITMTCGSSKLKDVLNPLSSLWTAMPQTTIPLYAQNIVAPHGGGSVTAVQVRATRAADGIALQLIWQDSSRDDAVPESKFGDAAAVEFPIATVPHTVLAMGHPGGPVDIWHWQSVPSLSAADKIPLSEGADASAHRASQLMCQPAQIPADKSGINGSSKKEEGVFQPGNQEADKNPQKGDGRGMHRAADGESPVEDLIAAGTANLRSKPQALQCLRGRGIWREGQWYVVIYKPFNKEDPSSPSFEPGSDLNIAFAVWNGSQGDRGGMKSVSNWAIVHCR